jgi:hypothetical protein
LTRVAEEATIVYVGLQKTSGDTHRCLHSMLDLGNPHVLAGAEWWTEEYKPRFLACGWDPIKEVTSWLRAVLEMVYNLEASRLWTPLQKRTGLWSHPAFIFFGNFANFEGLYTFSDE